MKPVYISGRGLACALGLNLNQSLITLRQGTLESSTCFLPGEMGGQFPYYRIPNMSKDWNSRAREIVRQVAAEAGIKPASTGVLFIASSSFDIGAGEARATERNYSAFTDKVVEWLEWSGTVYMINTACTSSLNALIAAHALLGSGEFEEALVLGIELDNLLTLGGFAAMQLLSHSHSKPFGTHRDGLVLGEAVAALRLTVSEPAKWKMLGGENVVDGNQPTGASVSAVVSMYQRTLSKSGLAASDIDLIKVQAAGSPGNDRIEAQGLHTAFTSLPALVSLKTAIGHTMGASGAAEIALLTACLEQNVEPVYTDIVDETLDIELAAKMPGNVRHVMATILGFGGSHASVALEQA
jgi:3-oxoacyl-[acyl-carrier-protein] synthase I